MNGIYDWQDYYTNHEMRIRRIVSRCLLHVDPFGITGPKRLQHLDFVNKIINNINPISSLIDLQKELMKDAPGRSVSAFNQCLENTRRDVFGHGFGNSQNTIDMFFPVAKHVKQFNTYLQMTPSRQYGFTKDEINENTPIQVAWFGYPDWQSARFHIHGQHNIIDNAFDQLQKCIPLVAK